MLKNARRKYLVKVAILTILLIIAVTQIANVFVDVNYNAIPRYLIQNWGLNKDVAALDLFQSELNNPDDVGPRLHAGFPRSQCGCESHQKHPDTKLFRHKNLPPNETSTCSKEASEYGMGQKVVSYSLYIKESGSVQFFLEGVQPNLNEIQRIFPGWLVRIYTDIPPNTFSCPFICKYQFLFWCDIKNIPKLGDVSGVNGRLWRFLPIGDPSVEIVLSRDLDSTPSEREREAVAEWERSSQNVHLMRDSQWHDTEILAGMWGLKNSGFKPGVMQHLRETIIKVGKRNETKFWDQYISKTYIYSPMKSDILAHDSYFCTKYTDTLIRPFPSQRKGQQFVGNDERKEMVNFILRRLQVCPQQCRPLYGQNWTYC